MPDSIWYQGYNYYFKVIVKEKNSDVIKFPYYCMVEILGEKIDPNEYLNFTDITFELDPIQRDSTTALRFSHGVNLTFVEQNFNSMFDVYVKNTTWIKHNGTAPVKDVIVTNKGADNRTLNLTVVFE